MKIFFYGVRDVEKPIFEEINKKFSYEMTLSPEYLNNMETAKLVEGHEAVVLRGNCFATKEVLDLYKSLGVKYLLTRTVGVNHIDLNYANELGFKMAYVPFYSPNAIAELSLTLAMTILRNVAYTGMKTSKKDFTVDKQMFSREIRNCTVGIVGLGRIGFTAAQLFKGLGAKVIGYDLFYKEGVEDIVTQVTMDELIKNSDIISLHAPYIKENGKIITEQVIKNMKKGTILINAGRGELMDAGAVADAVESGHLAGAGIDTLEDEGEIFFKNLEGKELENKVFQKLVNLYPKVIITPHVGSYTDEAALNMIETTFENLKSYIKTGDCKNKINI